MRTVIINGAAGVGKDTFVAMCQQIARGTVANLSSVDRVKEAAVLLGWDGVKDERGRQFLSDLKDMSTRVYDGPLQYLTHRTKQLDLAECVFIHMREPAEIDRAARLLGASTLLIRRDGISTYNNHADRLVENFDYNHIIDNNGTLGDLLDQAVQFMRRGTP